MDNAASPATKSMAIFFINLNSAPLWFVVFYKFLTSNNLLVAFVTSEVTLTLAVHYKGNTTPTALTKIAIKFIIIGYKENIVFISKITMIFLESNLAHLKQFCTFAVSYEIFIYLNSVQHLKNQSCCETGLVYFVHLLQNSSFAIQFHLFFQLTFGNFANEKN